jgi:ribosome-associated protein
VSTNSLRSGKRPALPPELGWAVEAAQNKKASEVTLLDLRELGAFTDSFVLCTGYSARQVQAISDAIEEQLALRGVRLAHREGYDSAEWVLLDYGDFIVHVFSERARQFYDLERLWRPARRTDFPGAEPASGANEP